MTNNSVRCPVCHRLHCRCLPPVAVGMFCIECGGPAPLVGPLNNDGLCVKCVAKLKEVDNAKSR